MNKRLMNSIRAAEQHEIVNEAWMLGEKATSNRVEDNEGMRMLLDAGLSDKEKYMAHYAFSLAYKLKENPDA